MLVVFLLLQCEFLLSHKFWQRINEIDKLNKIVDHVFI